MKYLCVSTEQEYCEIFNSLDKMEQHIKDNFDPVNDYSFRVFKVGEEIAIKVELNVIFGDT